jgi:hypothetical protein
MKRTVSLVLAAAVAGFAFASPAAASGKYPEFEDNCGTAPFGPEIKFDVTIDDAKMAELRKDVTDFIKASDQFQDCVNRMLQAGPKFDKKLDTAEKRQEFGTRWIREGMLIIDQNQTEKEKVGDDFNKLVELRKKPQAK